MPTIFISFLLPPLPLPTPPVPLPTPFQIYDLFFKLSLQILRAC